MSTTAATVAVVIVSFNTRNLLAACLESLRACRLPLRVLVVDNHSADGSAAMVRASFPTTELLALETNLGFAAANNLGLRQLLKTEDGRRKTAVVLPRMEQTAPSTVHRPPSTVQKVAPITPDYILLLNPDTVVHEGAIEALVAFLEDHPRVGVVGPRLLNPDGSLQPAAFRFPTTLMLALDLFPPGEVLPGRLYNSWWHGRYPFEGGEHPFAIDHPLGACMLTRRVVVQEVGYFDEDFFMYSEEVDWCYRVRQAGWAIWQVPQARVTHVGGAATSQFRGRMQVALWASRLRYVAKHASPAVQWRTRWLVRAGMHWAVLRAWWGYATGKLKREHLREQLLAYGDILDS